MKFETVKKVLMGKIRFGTRYSNGKILFYPVVGNPQPKIDEKPYWAVDIREIVAMFFVGVGALLFIHMHEMEKANYLLTGLLCYAIGRTVPGGK